MNALTYTAEASHNTWSKQGYLFENGFFISIFNWFNNPTYFCKQFQPNEVPEQIGWGKGVMRSSSDYQFFKKTGNEKIDFNKLKAKCSELPWINAEINGLLLASINSFDFYESKRIQEILAISRQKGIVDVQNTQKCSPEDIKYLIVGDNPGINELIQRKYFVGKSGQDLKKHFETKKLIQDFYKECLIFNKTILHTGQTHQLDGVKSLLGEELFNEILVLSAQHVVSVQRKLNVPILIFGLSELKEGKMLYPFWKTLMSEIADKELVFLFKHPSRDHFVRQWEEEKLKNPEMNAEQLLRHIGRTNMSSK